MRFLLIEFENEELKSISSRAINHLLYMPKCLAKYLTELYEISLAEERSLIIVELELH